MKEFLKYTLATVTGLVLVWGILTLVGLIILIGTLSSSSSAPTVKDNSVLVLRLSGMIEERSDESIVTQLRGSASGTIGLDQMLSSIRKAKEDDHVKGIYIESGMFISDSPASMQALRNQLADFKESGKWIVAYADQYTQYGYYVCSVADKVFLNPYGSIDWRGLGAETAYLKDLLAKAGIKMQVVKVGKYKSATEMFTADRMSDANREQITAYVKGIWNEMLNGVADGRNLTTEQLNGYADSLLTLAKAEDYVRLGLADSLIYTDGVKEEIKKMLGIDPSKSINRISPSEMCETNAPSGKSDGTVAVYYAVGDVVDEAVGGFYSKSCIAAKTVCADLEKLADDKDVKAVVLRVNSGGGSAYASEQIWRAVTKLREKKPVVVSMGGMAASGGYYLSCGANCIYAEPTTLTGSIGIFGMFPDMSQLLTDKLGLKFDQVATNEHSLFGTTSRPLNDDEMAHLATYIERGYDLFVERVADGRSLTVAQVDSLGQGRVWIGADAKQRNLVDSIGGTYDAIAEAARLAKIDEYDVATYPASPTWYEQLLDMATNRDSYIDEQVRQALGKHYSTFSLLKSLGDKPSAQARLPYHITIE